MEYGPAIAQHRNRTQSRVDWIDFVRWFGDIVAGLVDRLGWPAVIFLLIYFFVERHATETQKQEIVEQYILGRGLSQWYPLLVVVVIAILLYFAQDYVWRKRVKVLREEIERLSKWKSEHQQQQIETTLHHTRPPGKKR